MRICFVCPEYPPGPHGGVGTMTQVLARALVQAGHQVRVVGVYSSTYPAPAYEEDHDVGVWRLRKAGYRFGWAVDRYRLYHSVAKWVRAGKVDLVEAPDSRGWFAGWPKLPVPVVQRSNGSLTYFKHELGEKVRRTTHWREKLSYKRVDAWTAVSRYTAEITRRLFSLNRPGAILYNPISAPISDPPFTDRSSNKVVYTGTLARKKGIISLIDAWPTVKRRFRQAKLHIYGKDGRAPNGESMRNYLQKRLPGGFRDSVHFHGHVSHDEVFRALSVARVAVFPSYVEGFAFAPLESMSHGCPTIHTQNGSGPELIEHGRDGLLIDPDQPGQMAEAILTILQDGILAKRLSEGGRRRVLNTFTIEKLLPLNEAFYSAIIRSFQG